MYVKTNNDMFSCCRNLAPGEIKFPFYAYHLKDAFKDKEAKLRKAIQSLPKEMRPQVVAAFVPEGMSLQNDWVN